MLALPPTFDMLAYLLTASLTEENNFIKLRPYFDKASSRHVAFSKLKI